MKIFKIYILASGLLVTLFISSCRKDFLDAKPKASLVVPSSLDDYQALLDNFRFMNGATPGTLGSTGAYGGPNPMQLEVAADNYYIPDNFYSTFEQFYKSMYVWSKESAYGGVASVPDWSNPYRAVFYSNVVLDGINKVSQTSSNQMAWNNVKGSALFFRAWSFYQVSQIFAPFYEVGKAKDLLGIPLRLTSDISEKSVRSNLQETYDRIIGDLKDATNLLPNAPLYKTRPSLAAAYGLLARVYLLMADYDNAKIYAEKFLQTYTTPLINCNTLTATATYPFTKFNDEVVFSSLINNLPNVYLYISSYARIDSTLYRSYDTNDLRKSLFFAVKETNTYAFKGSYDGNGYLFCGIATDEVYLILAESLIRLHRVSDGLNYLNILLRTRYRTTAGVSSFVDYNITDEENALRVVLAERRKELVMRGLRFSDLRRLNKETRFATTIYRKVNGQVYELAPNDLRYTWPIPDEVIALTGMTQNPR